MSAAPAGRRGRRLAEAGRVLLWAALGALATPLDELHQRAGITVYPNPDWVGERLPLSPAYAAGGALFYLAYAALLRRELNAMARRGALGGRPLPALAAAFPRLRGVVPPRRAARRGGVAGGGGEAHGSRSPPMGHGR